jgi:hypothetical protein
VGATGRARGSTRLIARLPPGSVDEVAGRVWQIIAGLRASRTLHHLLPDLLPPIDRQYTVRFLTGSTTLATGDQRAFLAIFPTWSRSLNGPERPSIVRWGAAASWRPGLRR